MNTMPATISVFSESLAERDYLRHQLSSMGLNAISFERENTCIDNLGSIRPHVVIVQTESALCVWRFLFSLHLTGLRVPIMILSEQLSSDRFSIYGMDIKLHCLSYRKNGTSLFKAIRQIAGEDVQRCTGDIRPLLAGESAAIRKINATLPNIIHSSDSVLIVGEKGTGKEVLSRLITESSAKKPPFIKVDCSSLAPEVLINGALKQVIGLIDKAGSVTVLLDNVHLASATLQSDLLLLVEEVHKRQSITSNRSRHGARFISTSELRIDALVDKGDFRKDLFYRLNVIPLFLPPLRERKVDISMLMDYFIIDACIKNTKCVSIPAQRTRDLLLLHDWSGNLDELSRCMHRYAVDGDETCFYENNSLQRILSSSGESLFQAASTSDLPQAYEIKDFIPKAKSLSLKSICDEFVSRTERKLLKKALESTNWNRKKAASLLNISYKSMLNKMKAYDII